MFHVLPAKIQYILRDFWYTEWGWRLHKWFWAVVHVLSVIPIIILVVAFGTAYVNSLSEVAFGVFSGNLLAQVLYLIIGHILLIVVFSTYLRTMFSKPAPIAHSYKIPRDIVYAMNTADSYRIQQDILEKFILSRGLEIHDRDWMDCIRICPMCVLVKPDRCHHCRKCGVCVVGFDHHCPWIANCVHSRNRKLFILLLFYTQCLCIFSFITSYSLCSQFYLSLFGGYESSKAVSLSSEVVSIAVTQAAVGIGTLIMLVFHIFLVLINRTTLEMGLIWYMWKRPNVFNLGWRRNFMQYFGTNKKLWFVPVIRKGDPAYFLTKLKPKMFHIC